MLPFPRASHAPSRHALSLKHPPCLPPTPPHAACATAARAARARACSSGGATRTACASPTSRRTFQRRTCRWGLGSRRAGSAFDSVRSLCSRLTRGRASGAPSSGPQRRRNGRLRRLGAARAPAGAVAAHGRPGPALAFLRPRSPARIPPPPPPPPPPRAPPRRSCSGPSAPSRACSWPWTAPLARTAALPLSTTCTARTRSAPSATSTVRGGRRFWGGRA
jgi:hypothetical protein